MSLLDLNNEVIKGKIVYKDDVAKRLASSYRDVKFNLKKSKRPLVWKISGYRDYMVSEQWELRKAKYFIDFPYQCIKCLATHNIQLHHIKYDPKQYGKEENKDLAGLCRACHEDFHLKHGVQRDMHSSFKKWLRG